MNGSKEKKLVKYSIVKRVIVSVMEAVGGCACGVLYSSLVGGCERRQWGREVHT